MDAYLEIVTRKAPLFNFKGMACNLIKNTDNKVLAVGGAVAAAATLRFVTLKDEGRKGDPQSSTLARVGNLVWSGIYGLEIFASCTAAVAVYQLGRLGYSDLSKAYPKLAPFALTPLLVRSLHLGGGKAIVYFQPWVYELANLSFYPVNMGIIVTNSTWATKRTMRNFHDDPRYAPSALNASPKRIAYVKDALMNDSKECFDELELMQLFDSCPTIRSEEMYHIWRGSIICTGSILDFASHMLMRFLGLRWGKRYRNKCVGDPLLFNILDTIIFPVPIWGNVGIPMVEYRGKFTATMVYDLLPFQDYFRVLEEGDLATGKKKKLLGIWSTRDKIGGWFMLEAFPEADACVGLDNHRIPL